MSKESQNWLGIAVKWLWNTFSPFAQKPTEQVMSNIDENVHEGKDATGAFELIAEQYAQQHNRPYNEQTKQHVAALLCGQVKDELIVASSLVKSAMPNIDKDQADIVVTNAENVAARIMEKLMEETQQQMA